MLGGRTVKRRDFVVLSHQVSGDFFGSSRTLAQWYSKRNSGFNGFPHPPQTPAHTNPPGLNLPTPILRSHP